MTYKILNVTQFEDTIITCVELELDTEKITIDISHFRPRTVEEINGNIINRAISENNSRVACIVCSEVKNNIEINKTISF